MAHFFKKKHPPASIPSFVRKGCYLSFDFEDFFVEMCLHFRFGGRVLCVYFGACVFENFVHFPPLLFIFVVTPSHNDSGIRTHDDRLRLKV